MSNDLDRKLMWHGAMIFLLAVVSGWVMVTVHTKNPLMLVATHVGALISAVLLLCIGMMLSRLALAPRLLQALFWSLVISQYLFFAAGMYSAFVGTSAMFAGPPGMKGSDVQEAIALAGNVIGAIGSSIAALLLLIGIKLKDDGIGRRY